MNLTPSEDVDPEDSLRVFLYGSYMDVNTLANWAVRPLWSEVARLDDWDITFSPYATLIPRTGVSVYGIVAELSRDDVERLYSRKELTDYRSVEVVVETRANKQVVARCYVCRPTETVTPSPEYLRLVVDTARKLGFPSAYIEKLNSFA